MSLDFIELIKREHFSGSLVIVEKKKHLSTYCLFAQIAFPREFFLREFRVNIVVCIFLIFFFSSYLSRYSKLNNNSITIFISVKIVMKEKRKKKKKWK